MAGPVILALDEWHKSEIDRKELRELVRRSDAAGLVQFLGLIALMVATGVLAWFSIGGAWAVPAFALYGSIYAFGDPCGGAWAVPAFALYARYAFGEAAAHEVGHGAPFKSRWLNALIRSQTARPSISP